MKDSNYSSAYVTVQLPANLNRLLTESAKRSNRKKIQEALLRLEDHLSRYRSISELNQTIPNETEVQNDCTANQ